MNHESVLDIYRRAWALMSLPIKRKILDGLRLQDGNSQSGDALLQDFSYWCKQSDDAADSEIKNVLARALEETLHGYERLLSQSVLDVNPGANAISIKARSALLAHKSLT